MMLPGQNIFLLEQRLFSHLIRNHQIGHEKMLSHFCGFKYNYHLCGSNCSRQYSSFSCSDRLLWNYYCSVPCQSKIKKFLGAHLKRANIYSTGTVHTISQSIISDISHDMDIKKLSEQFNAQTAVGGKNYQLQDFIQEELEKKCKETVQNFETSLARKFKIIQLEHDFLYSEGYDIPPPEEMSYQIWLQALVCESVEDRLQFYLDVKQSSEGTTATVKGKLGCNKLEEDGSCSSIFKPLDFVSSKERWNNHVAASAMQYGQPLLVDMDFVDEMTFQEFDPCAKQVWSMYQTNHNHPNPFHLMLTGCTSSNATYRHLDLKYKMADPHFMVTTTEKSHLDLFSKSEMVYLSSTAKDVLLKFDPNTVYIVGAFSNFKTIKHPCYVKAKRQGIRCKRLPIDEHVRWPGGPKNLVLEDIIQILLAMKSGWSWHDAFTEVILRGRTVPNYVKQRMVISPSS